MLLLTTLGFHLFANIKLFKEVPYCHKQQTLNDSFLKLFGFLVTDSIARCAVEKTSKSRKKTKPSDNNRVFFFKKA